MHWIAPSEKDTATWTLEKRLWAAADHAKGILHPSPNARFVAEHKRLHRFWETTPPSVP